MSQGYGSDVETLAGPDTRPEPADAEATLGSFGSAGPAWDVTQVGPGRELGPFVVHRVLGRGAMGVVVLAHDRELDRPVAIKLLLRAGSEVARARLMREAQSTARLTHPNVVAVHRVGTVDGQIYVVMEYVDGGTLRDLAAQSGRTWQEIVGAYAQAGHGLAAAHAAGFVHRDFKPDNVLVGRDGRPRVTDFGLVTPVAAVVESPEAADGMWAQAGQIDPNSRLTQSGAVMGTPAYMAPEQFGLGEADPRADQFSYCVSLFEALYGQRPFQGVTAANLYVAIEAGQIVQVPRGRVPASVHAALLRGLQFDPARRWPSMHALLAELERVSKTGPRPAVVGLAVGCTVVVLAGGPAVYWLTRASSTRPCSDIGAELEPIWNDDVHAKLRAALQRSGREDLDVLEQLVHPRIDRYVETWMDMRTAACEATRVRGEQPEAVLSLHHACLDRGAIELQGVLALLFETSDERVLAAAPGVLDVLTPLVRCGDVTALEREGIDAEPSDEEGEVLRGIVRADALAKAGRWEEADAMLEELLPRATSLETPRVGARAHMVRVETRYAMVDGPGAVAAADKAIELALRARAHDVEAAARLMLLYTAALDGSLRDRAETLIADATDAVGRVKDDLAVARLHATVGNAFLLLNQVGEAGTQLSRAIGFYEDLNDRHWSERSATRNLRASVLIGQQQFPNAITEAELAREIAARGLGPEHPYVVFALRTRARAEALAERYERGLETQLEVRERWVSLFGPQHPELVIVETQLASLALELERFEAAREHHAAAVTLLDRLGGPPDVRRAVLLDQQGKLRMHDGSVAEAIAAWEGALQIYVPLAGEEHELVIGLRKEIEQARASLESETTSGGARAGMFGGWGR